MESVLVQPFEQVRQWVNGHVIVKSEAGDIPGTLLAFDYDGAMVQGEIRTDDGKRVADIFIPFHRIMSMAFTADATEPRLSTLPEYVPGKDNWTGER